MKPPEGDPGCVQGGRFLQAASSAPSYSPHVGSFGAKEEVISSSHTLNRIHCWCPFPSVMVPVHTRPLLTDRLIYPSRGGHAESASTRRAARVMP